MRVCLLATLFLFAPKTGAPKVPKNAPFKVMAQSTFNSETPSPVFLNHDKIDLSIKSFDPVFTNNASYEDIVVRSHRAPIQRDKRDTRADDDLPAANEALGNQFHGLFPCCNSAYQDGLDGQARR